MNTAVTAANAEEMIEATKTKGAELCVVRGARRVGLTACYAAHSLRLLGDFLRGL